METKSTNRQFFLTNSYEIHYEIVAFDVDWSLRVSTSGAHPVRNTAVGSLLTKGCFTDWMHSATARHEHEAQRNANGTALFAMNMYIFSNIPDCPCLFTYKNSPFLS